jgi:hypothetical protein
MKVFDMGILIIIILFNVKSHELWYGYVKFTFLPLLGNWDPWFGGPRVGRHSSTPSSGQGIAVPVVAVNSGLLAAASPVHGDPYGSSWSLERRPLLATA